LEPRFHFIIFDNAWAIGFDKHDRLLEDYSLVTFRVGTQKHRYIDRIHVADDFGTHWQSTFIELSWIDL
jgi:hypothetical protein